jgi:malate dehydrogenase
MFGPDQPVILNLIEIPDEKAMKALSGRGHGARGLRLPAARRLVLTSDLTPGFKDVNWALLIGAARAARAWSATT